MTMCVHSRAEPLMLFLTMRGDVSMSREIPWKMSVRELEEKAGAVTTPLTVSTWSCLGKDAVLCVVSLLAYDCRVTGRYNETFLTG